MNEGIYSLLSPALPIVILPAGVITLDVLALIESLCKDKILIETRNQIDIISACIKNDIKYPDCFHAQFYYAENLYYLHETCQRLENEKSLFFLQCYTILVIIDYTANKNIKEIKEIMENSLKEFKCPHAYVFYKATEDILDLFAEDTCITFKSYSTTNIINYIRQFIAAFVLKAFSTHPVLNNVFKKAIYVKISLLIASEIYDDALNAVKIALTQIDEKEYPLGYAGLLETYAMLGKSSKKTISFDKSLYVQAQWYSSSERSDGILNALSYAGALYQKIMMPYKSIDCGLKAIAYGYSQSIDSLFEMIKSYSTYPLMQQRAFELLYLCRKNGLVKKSSMFAFKFMEIFEKYSIDFKIFILNSLDNTSGLSLIRQLDCYVLDSLLSYELDSRVLFKIIVKLISLIGAGLSKGQQTRLFAILSTCTAMEGEGDLHLGLLSTKHVKGKYSLRQIIKKSCSVFIYSYIEEQEQNIKVFMPVKESLHLSLTFFNPYLISLPFTFSLQGIDQEYTYEFKPHQTKTIILTFVPQMEKEYKIKTIRCSIYGIYQNIKLTRVFNISAVQDPPTFYVRDNLYLAEPLVLYDGEVKMFDIWIGNTGLVPIISANLRFSKARIEIEPYKLPLLPNRELHLKCKLYANMNLKDIDFEVVCKSTKLNYETFCSFRQLIVIKPSLICSNIFALTSHTGEFEFDPSKQVLICCEIKNISEGESFGFKVNYRDKCYMSTFLGVGQLTAVFIPINRTEFDQHKNAPKDQEKMTLLCQGAEIQSGRKLTDDERRDISLVYGISTLIGEALLISWQSGDNKRGYINFEAVIPNLNIYQELEIKRPNPMIQFKVNGNIVENVHMNQMFELEICFPGFYIKKCQLTIGQYVDPKYGVMWDGKLNKISTEGQSTFTFKFCFTKSGSYNFVIHYMDLDHINDEKYININVNEN